MPPFTVSPTASVTPLRPRPRPTAERGNGSANIDVWPAAGGGLLVSLSLPILRPSPHLRQNLAGFFLKICPFEEHALTIPYVGLSRVETEWVIDIVCDELELPNEKLRLMQRQDDASLEICSAFFKAEWRFRAVASMARDLLLAEAAYVWDTDARQCALRDGHVIHTDDERRASLATFATGAALQPAACRTRLRCGREIRISAPRIRKPAFSFFKDAWLSAVHS